MAGRGAPAPSGPPISHNPSNDIEVTMPPDDTVSVLRFSPRANLLMAGSWDCKVRVWDVQFPGCRAVPRTMFPHERPVLCGAWTPDGGKVISAGCDHMAKMWDLNTSQPQQIAQHDAPIKEVFYLDQFNVVATGSWDKTVRYWDGRSPTPVGRVALPERVYTMDARGPALAVGTADRQVVLYDVRNPTTPMKTIQSPLKYQTRCIALFPNSQGFVLGSIEGRCAVQYISDADQANNFSFKCHRAEAGDEVWAVNGIGFNHLNTFFTVGSDGSCHFWDMFSKQRLKPFPRANNAVTAAAFNYDPTNVVFAYAVGYDWSKGAEFHNPAYKSHILLHPTPVAEISPRDKTQARR